MRTRLVLRLQLFNVCLHLAGRASGDDDAIDDE